MMNSLVAILGSATTRIEVVEPDGKVLRWQSHQMSALCFNDAYTSSAMLWFSVVATNTGDILLKQRIIMSYRNNSGRSRGFSSFTVGSKSRTSSSRTPTSLNAVPPPPSISRPNVSSIVQSSPNSSRFSASSHSVPPPNSLSKQGYHTLNAISQNAINTTYGIPTSRPKTEEE